jgi:sugar phosphate permease
LIHSQSRPAVATPEAEAPPSLRLLLIALVPFSLGFFFSYLYRAVNAVIAPDLVRDIGLSAGELGQLTAAYLFAFSMFSFRSAFCSTAMVRGACRQHWLPSAVSEP